MLLHPKIQQRRHGEIEMLLRNLPGVCATLFVLIFASAASAAPDADLMKGLEARTLGPATTSGRIAAIDVVQSDPNRIVIGDVSISPSAGAMK